MKNWINEIKAQVPEREEGQGTVEYAVVLGVLVVAIVTAFTVANPASVVTTAIGRVSSLIPAAGGG